MTITVYGLPGPQGSKRFLGRSKAGKGIMVESSAKVGVWRQDVKAAAIEALSDNGVHYCAEIPACNAVRGALNVHMIFTLPKPASAPKRRRTWPDRKPDLSKLVRSTEDALTDAGVWEDDARIVRLVATKCYPGEGTDALHIPGAVIHISEVNE